MIAQLHWVAAATARSVCSSLTVKSRLLTALADLAGVAAFLSYDVNAHQDARSLWELGLGAANEAGNADLVGTTLRQLAHQALHLNKPAEAQRLVRSAYATTVDPSHHASELALAEIAAYEGWCYASTGQTRPCDRALGRAQDHFENAADEQPPPWLAHLDRAEIDALRGHSFHVLAHHVPVRLAQLLADHDIPHSEETLAVYRSVHLLGRLMSAVTATPPDPAAAQRHARDLITKAT